MPPILNNGTRERARGIPLAKKPPPIFGVFIVGGYRSVRLYIAWEFGISRRQHICLQAERPAAGFNDILPIAFKLTLLSTAM